MTTNVAANLIPPSVVFSTLFNKKLNYRNAVILAAILALLVQPWKALADANNLIYNVCGILGALLGPISGIYMVSYLFEHKTEVDLVDIYKEEEGKYNYRNGWNVGAISILIISIIVVLLGKYLPTFKFIFDNSYVIGICGTGFVYYLYFKVIKKKGE